MKPKRRRIWSELAWFLCAGPAVAVASLVLLDSASLLSSATSAQFHAGGLARVDEGSLVSGLAAGLGMVVPTVLLLGAIPPLLLPTVDALRRAAMAGYAVGCCALVLGVTQVTSEGAGLAEVLVPVALATLSLSAGCHARLHRHGGLVPEKEGRGG